MPLSRGGTRLGVNTTRAESFTTIPRHSVGYRGLAFLAFAHYDPHNNQFLSGVLRPV